jgi:hypothetical protein
MSVPPSSLSAEDRLKATVERLDAATTLRLGAAPRNARTAGVAVKALYLRMPTDRPLRLPIDPIVLVRQVVWRELITVGTQHVSQTLRVDSQSASQLCCSDRISRAHAPAARWPRKRPGRRMTILSETPELEGRSLLVNGVSVAVDETAREVSERLGARRGPAREVRAVAADNGPANDPTLFSGA